MEKVTAGVTRQQRHWLRCGKPRLYGRGRAMSRQVVQPRRIEQQSDVERSDEKQILALHEAGDRALMSADLAVLAQIFADDYVQYNESGQAFTKQDVLNNLRTGAIRYPSIVSTGRRIRVFGDTA